MTSYYLPTLPWKLILKFNDTSHIRLKAKNIAEACAIIAQAFIAEHRERLTKLIPTKQDKSSHDCLYSSAHGSFTHLHRSYVSSLGIYNLAPIWRISAKNIYPDIIKDSDSNCFPYINRGYVSITALYDNQLKRLLKANKVKGYSKMTRPELLHAYLKV